jgi:Spx/MgsR family transcriptional regulator
MILYGIKNCDTVRKARQWLDQHHIDYRFHDFRTDGLEADDINRWLQHVPVDRLLNRRSTTWKSLAPDIRDNLTEDGIPALLLQHPTLIKRPVAENGHKIEVGFSDKLYTTLFSNLEH